MTRSRLCAILLATTPAALIAACSADDATAPSPTVAPGADGGFTTSDRDATSPKPPGDAAPPKPADAAPEAAAPCPIADDATLAAKVLLTADDKKAFYVNGQLIVDDTTNPWSSPTSHDVVLNLRPGRKNVIAVVATNEGEIDGRDRGLLFDLSFGPDGSKTHLVSDASWKVATTVPSNWFALDYDDSAFTAAVDQGKVGIVPWGALNGFDTTAGWLWAYDSATTAATKPDPVEKVYFRKTFWFDVAGKLSVTPTTCP